jgi:4'-phosphopantetheinyl transferase EntD
MFHAVLAGSFPNPPVLEQILPSSVVVAATRNDIADAKLFPVEELVVGQAVEKRRREFTTARACARQALVRLGFPAQEIPAGQRGAPCWPAGVVGSITHCDGYRACAVARQKDFATLGVDAELDEGLPDGLLGDIALPDEHGHLAALAREEPGLSWDRLLFSIKEAVYKAWFPLTQRWLGFEDAEVAIDREGRTFSARLQVPGPRLQGAELSGFSGRWLAADGLLFAAIATPAPSPSLVKTARGMKDER